MNPLKKILAQDRLIHNETLLNIKKEISERKALFTQTRKDYALKIKQEQLNRKNARLELRKNRVVKIPRVKLTDEQKIIKKIEHSRNRYVEHKNDDIKMVNCEHCNKLYSQGHISRHRKIHIVIV